MTQADALTPDHAHAAGRRVLIFAATPGQFVRYCEAHGLDAGRATRVLHYDQVGGLDHADIVLLPGGYDQLTVADARRIDDLLRFYQSSGTYHDVAVIRR